jgi:hypothetical protein
MGKINETTGYGVARDGRHFTPTIPTGATVSWKRLPEAVHVESCDRTATHLLAVWDRLEEMTVAAADLRKTARGRCVVFLADVNAIAHLVGGAVPRPSWLEPDEADARVLAASVVSLHEGWVSPLGSRTDPSVELELAWLKAAVIAYHQVRGEWPILRISVPWVLDEGAFPADQLRAEAGRLLDEVRGCLSGQATSAYREATVHVGRRV